MNQNSKFKIQKAKLEALVPRLLNWFARNARDLPWRRTRDPYPIWVSEIMLQQTQVKTVIPFWNRWMRELPTMQALARAKPERVLKLWEGLGYYTRARNLQGAAKLIVNQHSGRFPETFDEILALPGIGRYTAGAICSIAFNQPTPALDGNVIRVLTRIFGIRRNPREKQTDTLLWRLAEELVARAKPKSSPGENSASFVRLREAKSCSALNQSLMELGAIVCTPRQPKCPACPVRSLCIAYREGSAGSLPNSGRRATTTRRRFIAFVVERERKFLVRQRPAGVVNAHLWEFPNVETGRDGADPQAAVQGILGVRPAAVHHLSTVKHSITRYRITLEVYRTKLDLPVRLRSNRTKWLPLQTLDSLAFASAHKKILRHLETTTASSSTTRLARKFSARPAHSTCCRRKYTFLPVTDMSTVT